jgi:hypothetical protein
MLPPSTSPNLPDSADVSKWLRVRDRLLVGREAFPTFDQSAYYTSNFVDKSEAERQWDLDCTQTAKSVASIIDHWISYRSLPDLSPELLWLARVRFDPAIDLVTNMVWSRNHFSGEPEWLTMFPFPSLPETDVVRLLLTDWWDYRGSLVFFENYFRWVRERQG